MHLYVCRGGYVYMPAGARRAVQLGLGAGDQTLVPATAIVALNHGAIFPAPVYTPKSHMWWWGHGIVLEL